jgi:hypothetical protein
MKLTSILFISLSLFPYAQILAKGYQTNRQICYGTSQIPSLSDTNKCLGLVVDETQIPWTMPRKILFTHADEAVVSAMGSWSKNQGQIWKLQFNQGKFKSAQLIFDKTDRSHGLRRGPKDWIYYGDATQIYKFKLADPKGTRTLAVNNLPDTYKDQNGRTTSSSHPLTEFIFLDNGDLIVNIGAPSNDCSEEFKISRACPQRDQQAELRKYKYDPSTDSYSKSYDVIARGLRNSMGLLYNPDEDIIYQAENASDQPGTPDELNFVNPNLLANDQDFGWPFCFGDKNLYRGYNNFKSFCTNTALSPQILFPAHVAPLDLMYYKGEMFPEYKDAIMTSWHGHRPSGSRVAIYKTDSRLSPLKSYELSQTKPAEPLQLLTSDWAKPTNGHPKGRPVGLDYNQDGAIFIIDDANSTLLVAAKASKFGGSNVTNPSPFQDEDQANQQPGISNQQLQAWQAINAKVFKTFACQNCHSDVFTSNDKQTFELLIQNRWINPSSKNLQDQLIWVRMTGFEGSRLMPPAPAKNILASPELLNDLEKWFIN